MTETPLSSDAEENRGSPPRMPGWVKWPAITIGVLVLLLVVLQLTGLGGNDGPGRNMPGGDTPPASGAPAGHTPPAGGH